MHEWKFLESQIFLFLLAIQLGWVTLSQLTLWDEWSTLAECAYPVHTESGEYEYGGWLHRPTFAYQIYAHTLSWLPLGQSVEQQPQPHIDRDSRSETPTSATSNHATAQQQQPQPYVVSASDETPYSMSPNCHSTQTTQTKKNHKGKTKKAPKCTIFVDKKSGSPVVNLKRKNLLP